MKKTKKKTPQKVKRLKIEKLNFSRLDMKRIRRLLFMGVIIRLKIKPNGKYKVWIRNFPHLWEKALTPVSAYRRMFKKLKAMGVYLP